MSCTQERPILGIELNAKLDESAPSFGWEMHYQERFKGPIAPNDRFISGPLAWPGPVPPILPRHRHLRLTHHQRHHYIHPQITHPRIPASPLLLHSDPGTGLGTYAKSGIGCQELEGDGSSTH